MAADTIATSVLIWLVNYALQSTLVFGAVWVVTRALPERLDALSDSLWKCALVISIVAAILPTPVIVQRSAAELPLVGSLAMYPSASTNSAQLSPAIFLVVIWLGLAVVGLARLAVAYVAVLRTIGDRRPLTPAELEAHFGEQRPAVTVTCSMSLQIPIAIGREVCMPAWALGELTPEQMRTVTAHEAAHITRHDAAWRWAAVIASRVFFFQPLNHLAARRLRELAECLCDETAVRQTGSPAALASTLAVVASVVTRPEQRRLALLPAFASRESLTVRRVRRVLSSRIVATPVNRVLRHRGAISVAASGVLLVMAALSPNLTLSRAPIVPYVITAADPAGPFTLTVNRGKVIGATISGRTLAPNQLKQRGNSLELVDPLTGSFSIELTPQGGITWMPRPRVAPVNHN